MGILFYGYKRCDTCRKAENALQKAGKTFRFVDITEQPPPRAWLKLALTSGLRLQDLFNRSGVRYRELNMKDELKRMTEAQALDLLAADGRLCKRPLVGDGEKVTVGYRPDEFEQAWAPESR